MDLLISELRSKLEEKLPGADAQSKMISQLQRSFIEYFNKDTKLKDAAVLIILFRENGRLKTFLIERMPDPGPHSGQIAFPGGRKEIEDKDLIDTALREAEEEIGVKVTRDKVIGQLTPVQIPVSGYSVLPVICYIEHIPRLKKCPREVSCIFTVDLLNLLRSQTKCDINYKSDKIEVPCYVFSDQIVWGATAMVLSELEEVLEGITNI